MKERQILKVLDYYIILSKKNYSSVDIHSSLADHFLIFSLTLDSVKDNHWINFSHIGYLYNAIMSYEFDEEPFLKKCQSMKK